MLPASISVGRVEKYNRQLTVPEVAAPEQWKQALDRLKFGIEMLLFRHSSSDCQFDWLKHVRHG